nr:hypothetical protein [Pandoravirus aubagnensis]
MRMWHFYQVALFFLGVKRVLPKKKDNDLINVLPFFPNALHVLFFLFFFSFTSHTRLSVECALGRFSPTIDMDSQSVGRVCAHTSKKLHAERKERGKMRLPVPPCPGGDKRHDRKKCAARQKGSHRVRRKKKNKRIVTIVFFSPVG